MFFKNYVRKVIFMKPIETNISHIYTNQCAALILQNKRCKIKLAKTNLQNQRYETELAELDFLIQMGTVTLATSHLQTKHIATFNLQNWICNITDATLILQNQNCQNSLCKIMFTPTIQLAKLNAIHLICKVKVANRVIKAVIQRSIPEI